MVLNCSVQSNHTNQDKNSLSYQHGLDQCEAWRSAILAPQTVGHRAQNIISYLGSSFIYCLFFHCFFGLFTCWWGDNISYNLYDTDDVWWFDLCQSSKVRIVHEAKLGNAWCPVLYYQPLLLIEYLCKTCILPRLWKYVLVSSFRNFTRVFNILHFSASLYFKLSCTQI